MMGAITSGIVVTGAERHANPKNIQPGDLEWVTAIESINAEGWVLPPFIIVAGQYLINAQRRQLPATVNRARAMSGIIYGQITEGKPSAGSE